MRAIQKKKGEKKKREEESPNQKELKEPQKAEKTQDNYKNRLQFEEMRDQG